MEAMMAAPNATARRRKPPALPKPVVITIPFLEECLDFLAVRVDHETGVKQADYMLIYKRVEEELALYRSKQDMIDRARQRLANKKNRTANSQAGNLMSLIDVTAIADTSLIEFDTMTIEGALKIEKLAPLALGIWSDVLKELDRRGKVSLQSGSYDDVGNALITRYA